MNKKNDEIYLKKLKEIGTKAANHAASALSAMIKSKININLINLDIIKLEEATNLIENDEKKVVGVYFKLMEELQGIALIILPIKSSFMLIDTFSGKKIGSTNKVSIDFERSILMETGNIILGAFLTTFSSKTGLIVIGSIPYIAEDTVGSIFDSVIGEIGLSSDMVLIMEVEFIESSKIMRGWLYMLTDSKSSKKMLDALKEKNENY